MIGKKTDSDVSSKKQKDDELKDVESSKQETAALPKEILEENVKRQSSTHSQWSPKDKRDNSCPGNVETGSRKEENEMSCKSFSNSSKSVTGDDTGEINENSKSDSSSVECRDQSKDPRVERRIRNKVYVCLIIIL